MCHWLLANLYLSVSILSKYSATILQKLVALSGMGFRDTLKKETSYIKTIFHHFIGVPSFLERYQIYGSVFLSEHLMSNLSFAF